ncbi:MAG: ABC transporter ATP-binding protein [Corynebacterium sp.]|nr:ABC transporter ATP-binding protein [Corynebacterium sp.]
MAKQKSSHQPHDDLLIDMRGIVKTFNIGTPSELTILHGIDFDLAAGEFLSVVGTSGSGKSTLMNIIGLLDRPTSGDYFLDGVNVLKLSDDEAALYRSKHIGFVFQNFNLVGRISARKNVEMPMMYAGLNRRERAERASHLLEMVGMYERAGHLPNELSGGQKQRVAIARALSNEPDLMLADEPTGALDTATGRMVMDLFHDLNQNHGVTIALITHNPELAEETTRIVTMNDGVLTGPKAPRVPRSVTVGGKS